jgi:hypothetical protein
MTIREIAAKYDCSERTAKRWRKAGAPTDNPAEMEDWIFQYRSHRGVGKFSLSVAPESQPQQPVSVTSAAATDEMPDALGLQGSIDRLRAAEARAGAQFNATGGYRDAQTWISIGESLRKTELSLLDFQQRSDSYLEIAEVEKTWATALASFAQRLKSLPSRMAKQLEGLDAMSVRIKLADEMDSIIRQFAEGPPEENLPELSE